MLASGELVRLRRGVYGTATTPAELATAARVGGSLGCVSALRFHGAWTMPETQPHVRVARGVAHRAGARIHWTDERVDAGHVDPIDDAISVAIHCLDATRAIVALDSVLCRRLISRAELERICDASPRGRLLMPRVDGGCESGIETLARLALLRLGIRHRTQVWIGDARVDIVIGDRLVLELDGEGFHSRPGDFERDRARDRRLVAEGYLVLRASYRQVMSDWLSIEQQILALVRRDAHLWRAADRRRRLSPGPEAEPW